MINLTEQIETLLEELIIRYSYNIDKITSEEKPIFIRGLVLGTGVRIKALIADYIESIELPIKLQEHDPRVDARDVYNYAFNEAVNLCQAKLDEAVKELRK